MYRTIFPRCTVLGSVEPVPYSHFLNGAVPSKCTQCSNLFEGSCIRAFKQVENYLALDHGPCHIKGSTEPVLRETQYFVSKAYIPTKCRGCKHLQIERVRGFVCNLDREKWGAFPRSLDWGSWSPEHPNLGLKSGRSVSIDVLQAVEQKNEVLAIKAFRAAHGDSTLKEAREAYAELVTKLHGDQ